MDDYLGNERNEIDQFTIRMLWNWSHVILGCHEGVWLSNWYQKGKSQPHSLSSSIGHSIDSRSCEMICRCLEMTAFTSFFCTHDGYCGARECGRNC